MLALRPIIAVIALIFIPLLAILVWVRTELDPTAKYVLIGLLAFAALAMLRRSVFQPLRVLNIWRNFARQNEYEFFGSLSHEPFLKGIAKGRRFVAGVSAHRIETGNKRYRTLVSAPVDMDMPAGLRVYSRTADTWVNEYSDKHTIPTGDETVETELRCEGIDSEAVRTYVTDSKRRSLLLDFARSYPGMLLHGGLSEAIPAEPGGASGVITISVPGRVRDGETLKRFVSDVCDFATQLDAEA